MVTNTSQPSAPSSAALASQRMNFHGPLLQSLHIAPIQPTFKRFQHLQTVQNAPRLNHFPGARGPDSGASPDRAGTSTYNET
jgi:hypothetical protein